MDKDKTIGFQIRSIHNLIKRDVEKSKVVQGDATTMHAWAIKWFLENSDRDIFQKDFEEHFAIRPSTASKMLTLMEKNGIIVRKSVEYDARLKKISVTQKAVEINDMILKDIEKRENKMIKNISPDDLKIFYKVAGQIKINLEENDD